VDATDVKAPAVDEAAASTARLQELVRRAQQGDRSVLPELREALDANPKLWQSYGDLALQAQAIWLDLIAGKDLALQECVLRKLEAMRADLAGPAPTPLEKLLVERVAACWLQTMYADALYAARWWRAGPRASGGRRSGRP
jgi:hypothetical protein